MKIGTRIILALAAMLLVIWAAMIYWSYFEYRKAASDQAREFAESLHTMTLASLTGMMISGTIDQRDVYLDQVRSHGEVRELRVLRSPALNEQYGPGGAGTPQADDLESRVMQDGQAVFELDESGDTLRSVIPVLAKQNFLGKDCLQCHTVPEGTVLGAVSTRISLAKSEAAVRSFTLRLVAIAGLLALLMLAYIYLFIRRHVTRPLRETCTHLDAVAGGDLTRKIEVDRGDEIGELLQSQQLMQEALGKLVDNVHRIVQAASQGNFSQRIALAGQKGYGLDISVSVNELCETTEVALSDIQRVSGALAKGDLNEKIAKSYPGVFGKTIEGVNHTVEALSAIIREIHEVVEAGIQGDFGQRLDIGDKTGYSRTLAELLNELATTTEVALRDVMAAAQSLAQGDLTHRLDGSYPGLFGHTQDALNATIDNLQGLIREIKDVAAAITEAAQDIASVSQDLLQRTDHQAGSINTTAAALERFTATVHQNADHARQASELAVEASRIAQRGGQVVGESVETMTEISGHSHKISDIIGVIDGIAFQTNILALNAAVEAARAGEQGRGFAVVAGEVRNLAQRSAAAASEIKKLITASVEKVDQGTARAHQAGLAMQEIVDSIRSVANLISGISASSAEQSSEIGKLHESISEIDQGTRQNSAVATQSADSAQRLLDQAEELSRTIAAFRLPEQDSGSMRASALPALSVRYDVL